MLSSHLRVVALVHRVNDAPARVGEVLIEHMDLPGDELHLERSDPVELTPLVPFLQQAPVEEGRGAVFSGLHHVLTS